MKKKLIYIRNFSLFFVRSSQAKNLPTLAASSSFFFTICIIPLTLLALGFFNEFILYDSKPILGFIDKIKLILPDEIFESIQNLVLASSKILLANKEIGFFHYIVLAISSFGFFGSVWKAVDIISEVTPSRKWHRKIKNFLSIAISFALILTLTFIPMMLNLFSLLLKTKVATFFNLDHLIPLTHHNMTVLILSNLCLFLFFVIFFKYLLKLKVKLGNALSGSILFSAGLFLSKLLFFIYIEFTKTSLVFKFGSIYSILIFLIWIFLLILLFYTSINFTLSLQKYQDMKKLES